jgi:hypothetical protein
LKKIGFDDRASGAVQHLPVHIPPMPPRFDPARQRFLSAPIPSLPRVSACSVLSPLLHFCSFSQSAQPLLFAWILFPLGSRAARLL